MIPGRATLDGTERFAGRAKAAAGHFREAAGLVLSSIGLGTYLGKEDSATDRGYEESIAVALSSGVNVFDSAINYRGQKSERAIGRALASAFQNGAARRDEVFVSTKGGYLPHDSDDRRDPRRFILETFVATGIAPKAEIASGGHCMAPGYLEDQIDRSRRNLGLETIDLYYLHNIESQRTSVDRPTFRARLVTAVDTLEKAAALGRIARWGLATWDGLRVPPEHPEHLSLAETLAVAEEVAGRDHHFAAIQLPVNLAMAQAVAYRSQESADGRRSALSAANELRLAAFGSASLLQGRLAGDLPDEIEAAFPDAAPGAQRALQFSRSSPGMTTALVGVSTPEHAREDFALAGVPPADASRVLALFS
ncbi:MAG TPA: aldo/keto reductase [Thermoanaerobaculia bacterium]|nr:aldo/keto reductase [Thermoanaerobaculia bacterium]